MELNATSDLWVTAHGGLLGQAVDNLWDNACKYSEMGTPITFRAFRSSTDVTLTVQDDGIGIAKDEIARIVDPFYRSDDARSRGIVGTGLGLAIVSRIVDALGARMRHRKRGRKGKYIYSGFSCSESLGRECSHHLTRRFRTTASLAPAASINANFDDFNQ